MAVGFGIIGCGMISRFHARAIADIKGAKLVACQSATPASADKFAAETGCKAYYDLEADAGRSGGGCRHDRHAERVASGAVPRRGQGGKACDRGEAAGDHAQADAMP